MLFQQLFLLCTNLASVCYVINFACWLQNATIMLYFLDHGAYENKDQITLYVHVNIQGSQGQIWCCSKDLQVPSGHTKVQKVNLDIG